MVIEVHTPPELNRPWKCTVLDPHVHGFVPNSKTTHNFCCGDILPSAYFNKFLHAYLRVVGLLHIYIYIGSFQITVGRFFLLLPLMAGYGRYT